MRKLLLVLLVIISFFQAHATHLMGGEITWECIKDPSSPNVGQYIFTMKLYRDCDGTTLSQFAETIQVWENGVNIQNISCNFISNSDISPDCDVVNSGNAQLDCYGFNPVGAVEEYIYQSLPVQIIGTPPPSGWHFTWDLCCRNGAIDNLLNPDTQGFTLRASMYPFTDPLTGLVVPADPCFDSSPVFNESPKTIICSGYPFAYTHNASDPEIDSIRYYWAEPLDDGFFAYDPDPANNSPAAIPFVGGFTFNSPIPGAPALNPISGEISYNSNNSGNYVTVTRVESFKCGQKIAEIHRDIQVVLISCPTMGGVVNDPPFVDTPTGAQTWTIDPLGSSLLPSYETTVTAGEFVTFNIIGIDSNLYNGVNPQDLTMEVSGGQILDPITGTCQNPPCATFISPTGSPSPIISPGIVEGIFEWQTTCDHVSTDVACGRTTNLYQFSVKVYDDFCPAPAIRSVTLMVYVEADNYMQISKVQPSCFGNDGVVTIEPSLSITQIAWNAELYDLSGNLVDSSNNIIGNSSSLTGLSAGNYLVRAVGAGGCIVQDSVELLLAPNPLTIQTSVSHVSCYGGSDAEVGVSLGNGLLPYTFYINGVENLNPPPYDSLFTGLSEGTYVITGIDSDSCGLRDTVYIDAPQFPLQVLSSNSVVICDTSLGGSAYAYAAGGSPYPDGTYIFEWYNTNWGSITVGDSISNLGVGDYFLEVTDSNGCQENIPITVTAPQLPLSITPQLFGVVCTGDSDGAAVVFTGGGSAPYDYVWSDMLGNALDSANNIILSDTLSGLFAGSYHLMVTDNSGCTEEIFFNIGEPSIALEIGAVLVVDSIDCYGDQDGRGIVYMVNGSGSPGYSYLWDNGEIDSIANALSGGWHTVAVSDIRGCVVEDSVYIPENSEIKSNLTITNPISCYGDNDGAIYVSTQGGIQLLNAPNYDYFWSNGDTDIVLIDSLTHGSYYLTTRDSLGCVVVDSITIDNPDPLYVNAQEMLEVSCYGYSTGNAYAIGYGGTLPYIFSWITNGIIDSSSNDLSIVTTLFAGLETVQLTDVRGCIATDTVSIHQPDPLIVSISDSVLAYCVGVNTASATASVSGGTAPYIYEWDDNLISPQTSAIATSLDTGIYTVTVIDYRGCEAAYTVDLTSYSAPLSATINSFGPSGNSVSCYGSTDGALTVEIDIINSGTPPYIYQWFGSSVISANDSIFNLSAGGYSVTVTDANGCNIIRNQQLTSPAPLLYDVISADNTTCLGACDGELTLNIQGGITPYTAQLLNNQSGSSAINNVATNTLVTGVCTGDYTVLVQDFNACDAVLMLGGSDQAVLDTTITTDVSVAVIQDVDCYGSSTGEVAILAPQTALFYSYIWLDLNGDTISAATTIDSLLAGDYILHAAYETINGCTTVDTVTVSQNSLIYSNAIVTDASCNGYNDGSIITTTFGGVSPYSYSWSPIPSSLNNALNVPAGSYDLTITDASNCSVIESYNVAAPALLTAAVTASQTYILNTSVAGGTPPYSYSWIEQTQTGVILGTSSSYIVGSNGTYYVVVTDANNCTSQSNSTTYLETGTLDLVSSINLNIYPNPFKDEATVDFGQKINKARIKIFDTYGKLVERHELADTDKYIIQRMNKSSGVYFIEIEINQTRLNSKIIIK